MTDARLDSAVSGVSFGLYRPAELLKLSACAVLNSHTFRLAACARAWRAVRRTAGPSGASRPLRDVRAVCGAVPGSPRPRVSAAACLPPAAVRPLRQAAERHVLELPPPQAQQADGGQGEHEAAARGGRHAAAGGDAGRAARQQSRSRSTQPQQQTWAASEGGDDTEGSGGGARAAAAPPPPPSSSSPFIDDEAAADSDEGSGDEERLQEEGAEEEAEDEDDGAAAASSRQSRLLLLHLSRLSAAASAASARHWRLFGCAPPSTSAAVAFRSELLSSLLRQMAGSRACSNCGRFQSAVATRWR